MKNNLIAFFPGKFQPPHMGHILTISKLYHKYKKVIIGITSDKYKVVSKAYIKRIFGTIFPDAIIVFIPFKLTSLSKLELSLLLPEYDILITAENNEVLKWAKKEGIRVKNIKRSKCIGDSGTKLRKLYGL